MSEGNSKTSTGIEQNSSGLLCYLGWWITGIIFFVLEKENKNVRFHAVQSIIVFGILFILLFIIGPVFNLIPGLNIATIIISFLSLILWIFMMVKTAQGQMIKLPWAGNIAEKYANTTPAQPTQQQPPTQQDKEKKE